MGKSSLINALTGTKGLARASNTPGRTQEINFFTQGPELYLVDLPGYGYANAPVKVVEKWQRLLKQYLSSGRQTLRRAFVLIDSRHGIKAGRCRDHEAAGHQRRDLSMRADQGRQGQGQGSKKRCWTQVRGKALSKHPCGISGNRVTSSEKGDGIATLRADHRTSGIASNLLGSRAGSKAANRGASKGPEPMKTRDMNRDWIATARHAQRALPYLQRYDGAIVVIKLGGHAMGSDEAMESFARDVVLMRQVGVNPVIVHGGGPMINAMLDQLDIQSEFVPGGKRVTDKATVEVVEMVLSGRLSTSASCRRSMVRAVRAVGLSGKDANLMICEQADPALGICRLNRPR